MKNKTLAILLLFGAIIGLTFMNVAFMKFSKSLIDKTKLNRKDSAINELNIATNLENSENKFENEKAMNEEITETNLENQNINTDSTNKKIIDEPNINENHNQNDDMYF